ncbi:glycosyltransferase family 1 protein [Patescibacteria group bacterium]|nr:MAG: glycosyltransferase family 1 protein [Patescibacteria group bacterium]
MKIAIQAADLDAERIDGTRVYILNMLKRFGGIAPQDDFLIYHQRDFNSQLTPPVLPNYTIKKAGALCLWTQTRLAWDLWHDRPDALWMPMHNIPLVRRKGLRTVVTVHDLAYKYFPQHFPRKDLLLLNILGSAAINGADRLIAVSESTKRDILKFYPRVQEKNIRVIYHGFSDEYLQKEITTEESEGVLKNYKLQSQSYILYVGALQPRKNLERLVEAFELVKKNHPELKLVLAGSRAWQWAGIEACIQRSPFRQDIIITGTVGIETLRVLYRQAAVFAFPSLYEGFGIPILEAFASQVPVVTADNSSLREIAGEAALFCKDSDSVDLSEKLKMVLENPALTEELARKGIVQLTNFSWDKCARETLEWIRG